MGKRKPDGACFRTTDKQRDRANASYRNQKNSKTPEERYKCILGLHLDDNEKLCKELRKEFSMLKSDFRTKLKQENPQRYYLCMFLLIAVKSESILKTYDLALTELQKEGRDRRYYEKKYKHFYNHPDIWTAEDTKRETKKRRKAAAAERNNVPLKLRVKPPGGPSASFAARPGSSSNPLQGQNKSLRTGISRDSDFQEVANMLRLNPR